MPTQRTLPLVEDRNFILATRDTGYRSTAAAVAELVDNALQATATHVYVLIDEERTQHGREVTVSVVDNGSGMDSRVLQMALQFGGTDRFGDRSGPGRFGMGLPNSSVSQARRLDVYTWRAGHQPIHCYLDVDEIAAGVLPALPPPKQATLPEKFARVAGPNGTAVIWSRCDRLANRKAKTIATKLQSPLGRIFRYFIWDGRAIFINNVRINAIDPLFVNPNATLAGAIEHGAPLEFEVKVPATTATSVVRVRFSELPIEAWKDFSLDEKRRFGVVNGAGASVIRAGREVAYGWYLMGSKRRENYDDWWRCEIAFEPCLDEVFGVTHSKQEVNPAVELLESIIPSVEAIARSLNSRVRRRFARLKAARTPTASELAAERDRHLPPLAISGGRMQVDATRNGSPIRRQLARKSAERIAYSILVRPLEGASFYDVRAKPSRLVVLLNANHAFYRIIYRGLETEGDATRLFHIESLLYALARAEAETADEASEDWNAQKRRAWSNALAAFLED